MTEPSVDPELLRIHHWMPGVRDVLGPGLRAVVWVQGCTLACSGCMVPETWSSRGGTLVPAGELAAQMNRLPGVEGVTVSGGEPSEQAAGVAALLGHVKAAGKNTWLYSGYRLEELVARDDPATDLLLSRVDVLVDGRYEAQQAGALRWRGSANQRIWHLTDAIPRLHTAGDSSGGVEITLDGSGQLFVVGVPPPGFLQEFRAALESRGLSLRHSAPWRS